MKFVLYCYIIPILQMKKKTSLEKNVYLAQDQAQEPEFQPRSPTPSHLGHLG